MLETLIPILALAIYATLFIWSVIYIGSCGLAGLKNAATIFKFSHFTIRGFSARRLAYLLSFISTLLVPLHWRADWQGDGYLAGIALLFTLITLALCFLSPRTVECRFLPFALGVFVFAIHSSLCRA